VRGKLRVESGKLEEGRQEIAGKRVKTGEILRKKERIAEKGRKN
jgi:hypothetical protein